VNRNQYAGADHEGMTKTPFAVSSTKQNANKHDVLKTRHYKFEDESCNHSTFAKAQIAICIGNRMISSAIQNK